MKTEEQIVELESRLAFQEHSINELNEIVTRQQGQLDTLLASVQLLNKKLKEVAEVGSGITGGNDKPPHY